jgi:uncharacterized protein YbgA (DUF1722 family)
MSRQPGSTAAIGRILADAKGRCVQDVANEFIAVLMETLAHRGTRKTHTNVLQHIMGYLKRDLHKSTKQELIDTINSYRNGVIPLIVPLTLLRHHFSCNRHEFIEQQVFMQPYPDQLGLRSQI